MGEAWPSGGTYDIMNDEGRARVRLDQAADQGWSSSLGEGRQAHPRDSCSRDRGKGARDPADSGGDE